MLFGRAHEELEALAGAGIPVEVVPGITAALAASASLKASLTRRGVARHVAFVTPRAGEGESPAEWIRAASCADTVALYMASTLSREVAAALLGAGRPASTPAVFVEDASLPTQRHFATTLGRLATTAPPAFEGPTLLLVGEALAEIASELDRSCPVLSRTAAA